MIKLLSEVASRAFGIGAVKPNSAEVMWRSIGKLVPAKAAAPSGE